MTGYVADLSWKSGARAIEKLDRLRSTMAVNVLICGNKMPTRYDMIYLLTEIGLSPGGSNTRLHTNNT